MSAKTGSHPHVSVVIPTYNRKESLLRTLASLSRQTYPAEQFEVILVDDGGSDGTEGVTELRYPFRLRYVRQANQGAAAARNRGALEASGDVLIFLDDDISVDPQFVDSFQAELGHDWPIVAVGTLRPPRWQDQSTFRDLYARLTATAGDPDIAFTDCLSGVLAVKGEHFRQIGGMQDVAGDSRTAWGDVDFGYRAHCLGFHFRRALKAVGYHDDQAIRDLQTYCRVQENASRQAVRLFQKYPELRACIPMFRDKDPIAWRQDPPALILRKLARQVISLPPALRVMEGLARTLETRCPSSAILKRLYRWIVSAYIYRGFREGLQGACDGRA